MNMIVIIVAIAAFLLGIFIGSRLSHVDGMFIVNDTDEETTRWILDVKIDPKTIPNKKEIRLKVKKMTEGDV